MNYFNLGTTVWPDNTGSQGTATHHSNYGIGGLKQFQYLTDTASIAGLRMATGSIVYIQLVDKYYRWSNSSWVLMPFMTGSVVPSWNGGLLSANLLIASGYTLSAPNITASIGITTSNIYSDNIILKDKLTFTSSTATTSISYNPSSLGVLFPDGLIVIGNNDTVISNNIQVSGTGSFGGAVTSSGIYITAPGKFYHLTQLQDDVFIIIDIPNGTLILHIDADNRRIVVDSDAGVYKVGVGISEPVATLDINGSMGNGNSVNASGNYSHALGSYTIAPAYASHALGSSTIASGGGSHALGVSTIASGEASHALGSSTEASGDYSHALGQYTIASAYTSHALGQLVVASGAASHALGASTVASGVASHALGLYANTGKVILINEYIITSSTFNIPVSNANLYFRTGLITFRRDDYTVGSKELNITSVGDSSITGSCDSSLDETSVYYLIANKDPYVGNYSHALGLSTEASGVVSHALGASTIASGDYSHALGVSTIASAYASHALGQGTTTSTHYQLSIGSYNTSRTDSYFVVGTGSYNNRADGFWVTKTGLANAGLGFSSSGYIKIGGSMTSSTGISSPLGLITNLKTDTAESMTIPFMSGFGGSGWRIATNNNRHEAQFDDLWIRGKLSVYEMVINQIRATNGSLWISDAAKATSASYNSTTKLLVLFCLTGSLIPFIYGDIVRSKRWGMSGSTTRSVWDITTTVSAVNYATGYVTLSAPDTNNNYTVTASGYTNWTVFANDISISGSLWVRVGNTGSDLNRRGSIYITSNDLGGPFIDVYDNVSSSVLATSGNSTGVSGSKTKVRLGQLSGITDNVFGQLSGYGLYAQNVYLKGNISASNGYFSGTMSSMAGSIGGWLIQTGYITSSGIKLASIGDANTDVGLSIGQTTNQYGYDGVFLGYVDDSPKVSFRNLSDNVSFDWNGIDLGIQTSNFTLSQGNIYAKNAVVSGSISSSAGNIGGWSITDQALNKNDDIILGSSSALNTDDIFVGSKDGYAYFQLGSTLKYTNSSLIITGSINASTGSIGGWTITNTNISSLGIVLTPGTTPYIGIGTTTYKGNGIYIGKSNNASMSLWSSNQRGLSWDGSTLIISGSNFTLSSEGNISASNAVIGGTIYANAGSFNGLVTSVTGSIGGWNITSTNINSTSSFSTVSITTNGYPALLLFDVYNNFTFSAANSAFYTNTVNQYTKNLIMDNWLTKSIHCSASIATLGVGIRISKSVPRQTIIKLYNYKPNTTIYKNINYVITTDCSYITLQDSGDLRYSGRLFLLIYTSSDLLDSSKLYSFSNNPVSILNGRDINEKNYEIVWTGSDSTKAIYPALSLYLDEPLISPSGNDLNGDLYFTFSGIRLDKFNKISQLSLKGLLIFNSPSEYVQIMADSLYDNKASAGLNILKANEVYVDNTSIRDFITNPILVSNGGTGNSNSAFVHGRFLMYDTSSGKIVSSAYSSSTGGGVGTSYAANNGIQLNDGTFSHVSTDGFHHIPSGVIFSTDHFGSGNFLLYKDSKITNSTYNNLSFAPTSHTHNYLGTYTGITLSDAKVISAINVTNGTMTTASRTLGYGDVGAAASSHVHGNINETGILTSGVSSYSRCSIVLHDLNKTILSSSIEFDSLSPNFYLNHAGEWRIPTNTTYTAGTGLNLSGTTFNHIASNGFYHLPTAGTTQQVLIGSSTAGSGSWSSNIQISGTGSFSAVTTSIGFKGDGSLIEKLNMGNVDTGILAIEHGGTNNSTGYNVDEFIFYKDSKLMSSQYKASNFVQRSGDTMTGPLTASAGISTSMLRLGSNTMLYSTTPGIQVNASMQFGTGYTLSAPIITASELRIDTLHGDTNSNYIYVADGVYFLDSHVGGYIYFDGSIGNIIDTFTIQTSNISNVIIDELSTTRARTIITNSTSTTYTVSTTMVGKYNRFSSSNTINVYISTQSTGIYSINTGSVITFFQNGDGVIAITKSPSVTLNSYNNGTQTYGLYSSIQLINVSHNTWDLIGAV